MKPLIVAACAVLVCAFPALADAPGGTIAIFADPLGGNCYPQYVAPGLFQIYVVHINHTGMAASEFKVVADPGFTGTYLGEYPGDARYITVGYAFEGIGMAYGGMCLDPPIHLLTMSFYLEGSPQNCCYFSVVENPWTGKLQAVNCVDVALPAEGGTSYINPDGTCQCVIPGVTTGVPTPTPWTWGQVKALYAKS